MKLEVLQSCPPIIRDFLTYNETIKGKSSRSVEGYFLDLQTFFRYLLLVRGKVTADTEFEKIDITNNKIFLKKRLAFSISLCYYIICIFVLSIG